MAGYIDRDALLALLEERRTFLFKENGDYDHYASGFDEACDRVEDFSAADVAPVVRGRWIPDGNIVCCSECKTLGSPQWKGCPVCLARMDGE